MATKLTCNRTKAMADLRRQAIITVTVVHVRNKINNYMSTMKQNKKLKPDESPFQMLLLAI